MGGGEQEGPSAVVKKFDEIARAANVAAERSDGFRQRPHLNINASVQVEVVDGAAAVASQHAGGVRVVDHHDGAVLFRQRGQLRQCADVAVHGKDAIGDDQLVTGLVLHRFQLLFGVRGILVAEDLDLGARQPGAVDDAGVVQLVGDDEVIFAQQR